MDAYMRYETEGWPTVRADYFESAMGVTWVFGAAIGAFSGFFLPDILGRRGFLIYNSIPLILGALLGLLAGFVKVRLLFLLCLLGHRFLVGLHNGVAAGVGSMYLTEIAPLARRGMIGTLHQLAITVGILIAQVVGFKGLFGTFAGSDDANTFFQPSNSSNSSSISGERISVFWKWHYELGLNIVPALFALVPMFMAVESPRFIFANTKKEEEARKALMLLRNNNESAVRTEMEEILTEIGKEKKEVPFLELFSPKYKMATFLNIGLNVCFLLLCMRDMKMLITLSSLVLITYICKALFKQ